MFWNLDFPFKSMFVPVIFVCWSTWLLFLRNWIKMVLMLYNIFPQETFSPCLHFWWNLEDFYFFFNLITLVPITHLEGNAKMKLRLLWVSSSAALKPYGEHLLWIARVMPDRVLNSMFFRWLDWPFSNICSSSIVYEWGGLSLEETDWKLVSPILSHLGEAPNAIVFTFF